MISASGSFEDFMEHFRKRHSNEYGLDSRAPVPVKAQMPKVEVKDAPAPVSVRLAGVLGGQCQSAVYDLAEIADNWDGEAEVVE